MKKCCQDFDPSDCVVCDKIWANLSTLSFDLMFFVTNETDSKSLNQILFKNDDIMLKSCGVSAKIEFIGILAQNEILT